MTQGRNPNGWIFILALVLAVLACNYPRPTGTPLPDFPLSAASPTPPFPAISPPPSQVSVPTTIYLPLVFAPGPAEPTPAPASGSLPAYQPVYEPAACAFPVPAGYNPECGYLVVPVDRSQPNSPLIRLHVAVFPSRSPHPAPDPVVHLAGGPGSSSLGVAGYMLRQGLDAVLDRRDFILFDQRGTGYSLPRLDCPERDTLTETLLESRLTPWESNQAILGAFRDCRDRLIAVGIDLSAYNSAASAADINDLRRALGYEQLNLYGVSYGTRLALTVMRDYPEAVRSAVLDSVYPPEVNLYTSTAPNAARAINLLFDRCAADPACSAAYPELRDVFFELVDQLNADPAAVSLAPAGIERTVLVDGSVLVDVLFTGLYNPSVAASMPKMIFDVRQGDYTLLRERLGLYFDTATALGMQVSVQCNEEIPFSLAEEAALAAQEVPSQIAAFYPNRVEPLFAVCREWGLPPPDPLENQPVASELPALILAGEYDPITPPEWGRQAAGYLSQSRFFEFPGHAHWVTRSSRCAQAMALAFWKDPTQAPDTACLQTPDRLNFSR